MVNFYKEKIIYTVPKIVQKEKIERLATKLILALLESETVNYGNQKLQSIISACLETYTREEKERANSTAMGKTALVKEMIKEIKTSIKRKETKEAGYQIQSIKKLE
ncbi:hypothetical protein F8M41_011567 [Gigaspora margarita]|uniref:Uncharacterized protein n=1 Tax=Gigaspora margarita TaxID=4874 RepID=A0A8H3X1W9_GIGMA|nr:hypothetical protein F8M41_011567 [Gigaspora margarita]